MYEGFEPQGLNLPSIGPAHGPSNNQNYNACPGHAWLDGPRPSAIGAIGATGPIVMVNGASDSVTVGPDPRIVTCETPSGTLESGERASTAEWAIDLETIKASNARIEEKIDLLLNSFGSLSSAIDQPQKQEWYTTDQVAKMLGVKTLTVQEWCRDRRIQAEKQRSGRGRHLTWVISHLEIERFRKEGHLPLPRRC